VNTKAKTKRTAKRAGPATRKRSTVGSRIVEGLEQAIAWTRGENDDVRVTLVHVPDVNVREVRTGIQGRSPAGQPIPFWRLRYHGASPLTGKTTCAWFWFRRAIR
jgi:hypothetical protein